MDLGNKNGKGENNSPVSFQQLLHSLFPLKGLDIENDFFEIECIYAGNITSFAQSYRLFLWENERIINMEGEGLLGGGENKKGNLTDEQKLKNVLEFTFFLFHTSLIEHIVGRN